MTEHKRKMSEDEAIYCLKAESERYPQVCEECPLYGETGCDHCYDDANDVAIKALEMISKRDELEDFNTLENYIAEWNKYKVFHSDKPTEELHWMHELIHYYMVQFKLYRDSKLSPKEVLEMKTAYKQYRALGTVEELTETKELYDYINKVEADIWKLGMGCDDMRKHIKQTYKQFREAEYNNGWIPCSEKLPEDREEKLVYLSSGRPTIAKYNEHILPHDDCPIGWGYSVPSGYIDFESETVIAWQPLPEPYQG